jgi:hypothetical protein
MGSSHTTLRHAWERAGLAGGSDHRDTANQQPPCGWRSCPGRIPNWFAIAPRRAPGGCPPAGEVHDDAARAQSSSHRTRDAAANELQIVTLDRAEALRRVLARDLCRLLCGPIATHQWHDIDSRQFSSARRNSRNGQTPPTPERRSIFGRRLHCSSLSRSFRLNLLYETSWIAGH